MLPCIQSGDSLEALLIAQDATFRDDEFYFNPSTEKYGDGHSAWWESQHMRRVNRLDQPPMPR